VVASGREAVVSADISDAVSGVKSIDRSTGDGYRYTGASYFRHAYLGYGSWSGGVTVTDNAGNATTRNFTVDLPRLTTAPTAQSPPTAQSQPIAQSPPIADTAPPQLAAGVAQRQRVLRQRAVRVRVSCSESCLVVASGSLTIQGRRYALAGERDSLKAGQDVLSGRHGRWG